jgi:2'-5' RNA ligase
VALSVCLLFDERADRAVRRLWDRLEDRGVRTLRSHTHGRHVPHLSYAVLRDFDTADVEKVLENLPDAGGLELGLEGVGFFRRGRCWLIPSASPALLDRQRRVVAAITSTGAGLHWNYLPGVWVPHCTLAPRVLAKDVPTVIRTANEVLPLRVRFAAAGLVDSADGVVRPLTPTI